MQEVQKAPGEVDAFSHNGASDRITLERIESNFRAREPKPYLTEEEGRWLLDVAHDAVSAPPRPETMDVTCPSCDEDFEVDL